MLPLKAIKTLTAVAFALCGTAAYAQQSSPPAQTTGQVAAPAQRPMFKMPDDVSTRDVDIWSDGTRMQGTVLAPKAAKPNQKFPCVVMAHGWGGTAAGAFPDGSLLAQNGYVALAFDYRGWGRSDSRVILTGKVPEQRTNNRFTAEVQEVREVVEPIAETIDWQNALNWIQAEPQCDTNRIGIWGTSFSGGLVIYVASRDHRVKAIYSQIGAFDGREPWGKYPEIQQEAIKRARGEIGYPGPLLSYKYQFAGGERTLRGWPMAQQFMDYAPVEEVKRMGNIPMLLVIAGDEELFDNKDHALKAFERHVGPDKKLVTIPGLTHYGVYGQGRPQANQEMLAWFAKYLKK